MKLITKIVAAALMLGLGACSGTWTTNFDAPLSSDVTRGWRVSSVQVVVPESLTTSEQNSYAPNFDVIWHGEALGDRKVQVAQIVEDGVKQGSANLRGSKPVTLQVVLARFHAVTPIAVSRAPGAVHDIRYTIQAFDRGGNPLTPPVDTTADLEAFVGPQAIIAAQGGQTQKVRIRNHLASVTAGWLGVGPDPRRSFTGVGR